MAERYPGYDVLAKSWTHSWNAITRAVINRRLAIPREPRFLTQQNWETLNAVCARIMPQPFRRPAIPLAAYVDAKLFENRLDGYRYAALPEQGEAWRRGLTALEQEATDMHGGPFHTLPAETQDALLLRMQQGNLRSAVWAGMPSDLFFAHRVLPDITHAYYAHPAAWSEIGFGGPASPRGYVRMQLDRRDPWEAVEARPGQEERARRDNARVG
jgi:hypothetical protein